jgi:2,3-dimethylmalate lyase
MTGTTNSAGARLRALFSNDDVLVVPGSGDALSARLIESAGFEAVYMSGGWTSGARGFPDFGILTLNEMVENARYIANAITIPLIADADTGFGDHVNVRRCVQAFEDAGVAAIHLEDQALPKKCGLMEGKNVVPADEMAAKLRTAADARRDQDFLLIARTDALGAEGLDRTIDRGGLYFDAGADMLWVEGLRTAEEAEAVANSFRGRYLLFNKTPRGYGPAVPLDQVREWGYTIMMLPVHLVLAALQAQHELLDELRATGSCDEFEDRLFDLHEFNDSLEPKPSLSQTGAGTR